MSYFFFFQAEDGIRDFCLSRGLGDVYKRQVKTVETHQHRKIACLEEIAYLNGWITKDEVLKTYELVKKNQYGQYLKDVLDGKYREQLY